MRARLIVIPLVAVLVTGALGAAGYGGYRLLLARQQDHYAAGHAGYLRGDCRQAMPLLEAADVGRLDDAVAGQAARERRACGDLQSVRDRTAKQPAELALKTYVALLVGKPDGPMTTAGRRDARALFDSFVKHKLPSTYFCTRRQSLQDVGLLVVGPQDELAAPFLAACGKRFAKEGAWSDARVVFTQVQRELPSTRQAVTTADDLARATTLVVPASYWGSLNPPGDFGADASLRGKVRLILTNASSWNVELSMTGPRPLFTGLPECKGCKAFPVKVKGNCNKEGRPIVLTLPAGRHPVQVLFFDPAGAVLRSGGSALSPPPEPGDLGPSRGPGVPQLLLRPRLVPQGRCPTRDCRAEVNCRTRDSGTEYSTSNRSARSRAASR